MDDFIDEWFEETFSLTEKIRREFDPAAFLRPIGEICKRAAITLDVAGTVSQAISVMQARKSGNVILVRQNRMAGIITERDLLMKVLGQGESVLEWPVTQIMTADPDWLLKEDSIAHLLNKMYVGRYRHMPIVDRNMQPLHTISLRHILQYLVPYLPSDVINLPPEPFRGAPERFSG